MGGREQETAVFNKSDGKGAGPKDRTGMLSHTQDQWGADRKTEKQGRKQDPQGYKMNHVGKEYFRP